MKKVFAILVFAMVVAMASAQQVPVVSGTVKGDKDGVVVLKPLFGAVESSGLDKASAISLFSRVFTNMPKDLLVAEVRGHRVIQDGNPATVEIDLEVRFDNKVYAANLLPPLLQALEQTCKAKSSVEQISEGNECRGQYNFEASNRQDYIQTGYSFRPDMIFPNSQNSHPPRFLVNVAGNPSGTNLEWHWYDMDKDVFKAVVDNLQRQFAQLRLTFLGDGDVQIRKDVVRDFPLGFSHMHGFYIAPTFWLNWSGTEIGYGRSYVRKIQLKMAPEELQAIKAVKCSFIPIVK